MSFILALATNIATGATPTTPQCDKLDAAIADHFTIEAMGSYQKATSPKCKQEYMLYPRDQIVGHTGTNGWAEDDPAEPDSSAGWALVSHGIGQKLFTLNEKDEVVPSLAEKVEKEGNDWVLTLKSGRKFSDGSPVTATAVETALKRTNGRLAAAKTEVGTMSFVVQGETTLKISSTKATPAMDVVLANWPFVIYKAGPSGDIETSRVFSGPYALATTSLTATGAVSLTDDVMDLVPNAHYPDAEKRLPTKIKKFASGADVATALKNGEIDMGFNLPPAEVPNLNWHNGVQVKSFLSGYEYMGFFNNDKPALADKNVRKALALAIDRTALAAATAPAGLPANLKAGMAATGAFPSSTTWGSSRSVLPTDAAQAATLLTNAGWVLNANGIREKNGVELALDIVYYTFRPDLVTMAPLIKASYEALGIKATTRVNDDGNFVEGSPGPDGSTAASGFDMLLWAQHTLPAGDPKWFLDTFFRSGAPAQGNWGQKNFANVNDAAIDTALDTITTATGDARTAAVNAAHDAILDSYAVTFLSVPVWHVGLHSRMATYEPWGSDYYAIKETMPSSICSACDAPPPVPVASPPPPSPVPVASPPPPNKVDAPDNKVDGSKDDDVDRLTVVVIVLAVVAALAIAFAVVMLVKNKLGKKAVTVNKGAESAA